MGPYPGPAFPEGRVTSPSRDPAPQRDKLLGRLDLDSDGDVGQWGIFRKSTFFIFQMSA